MSTALLALLAALPIAIVLALMLAFRWPAAKAGAVGLALAAALAWWVFGFGIDTLPAVGPVAATLGSLLEAGFLAATILWIILPALFLYHLQQQTGAIEVIRHTITSLSADPRLTAILIAWFFALFIEGAAGFGTPVALAAPLLVSMGFPPVQTIIIVLVGHAIGVSYGAVGTPVLPLIEASGLSAREISAMIGLYHSLLGWIMMIFLMLYVKRAAPDHESHRPIWPWAALATGLFVLPYFLISRFIGPELPSLGGALAGAGVFVAIIHVVRNRQKAGREARPVENPTSEGRLTVLQAGAPYLALIVLVLATRLAPAVNEIVFNLNWEWELFGVFSGSFRPLYQPGTLLFAAAFAGALFQGADRRDLAVALGNTVRQLAPITLALLAMLGLSRIMVHAGLIDTLAQAAAALSGQSYPLFAPIVGALGSFVTGSATASNILFADFQRATAETLQISTLLLMGAQSLGSAIGNIICPHNIIAGSATVGITGKEGEVLRVTLVACLIYALFGGGLALGLHALGLY